MTDGGVSPVNRRYLLEFSRDQLLSAIDECRYQKDLPPLVRELRMVLAELDALPTERADAPADEIARQREARRRKAAGE